MHESASSLAAEQAFATLFLYALPINTGTNVRAIVARRVACYLRVSARIREHPMVSADTRGHAQAHSYPTHTPANERQQLKNSSDVTG